MKLWMVRATTTVLLWTCVVQFTAIGDTWGRVCLWGRRRASRRPRRKLRSSPARDRRCRSPSSRRTRCRPRGKVAEKAHEVTLHTGDIDHSICAVRSMAEFGLLIAEDMIKDINKSLKIMLKTQPKRGLIQNPSWGFQSGKSSGTWDDMDTTNGGSSWNYLSSMFNTAKQKASSLRWPQPGFTTKDDGSKKSMSFASLESSQAGGHGASTHSDAERDNLPVSSQLSKSNNTATMDQSLSASYISQMVESYNRFIRRTRTQNRKNGLESKEAEGNRE